jgi:hypothetical protein
VSYINDRHGCVERIPDYDDESDLIGGPRFRDPGGRSALRAGIRSYPCPTCKRANALTRADVQRGYQCDRCADAEEGCF